MKKSRRSTGTTRGGTSPERRGRPAHRPRKRVAQHFLERPWVERLVAALDARPTDTFIEIGPGRGALTHPLAARVPRLLAIEIDRDLAAALKATAPENVEVVEGDVLRQDLAALVTRGGALPADSRLRVVGNLPYNISSPVLFKLMDVGTLPIVDATLMLQREVADRLLAQPGSRDYGRLTVLATRHATIARLFNLPPGAFRPAPAVHSSVVRLTFHPPAADVHDADLFERLVRELFSHRRKTLLNALKPLASSRGADANQMLASAEIDGTRRPETLDLTELARLANALMV